MADSRSRHIFPAPIFSSLQAAIRLSGFLCWTLTVIPFYTMMMVAGGDYRRYARLYWSGCARILGIKVRIHGTPVHRSSDPVLFVANHVSYLDIIVLGALLKAAFVAKKEVASWPGISLLAKLGRTIFVERRSRRSADQLGILTDRLAAGEKIILFPEGTSNDGNRVLPFKSTLFSVAEKAIEGKKPLIQPISIAYTGLDGMPLGRGWRSFYAWYGDMDLAPHLWKMMALGAVTVDVVFYDPVSIESFKSRKDLSDHCWRLVRSGVVRANHGGLSAG